MRLVIFGGFEGGRFIKRNISIYSPGKSGIGYVSYN